MTVLLSLAIVSGLVALIAMVGTFCTVKNDIVDLSWAIPFMISFVLCSLFVMCMGAIKSLKGEE